jgi:Ni/Co efflux regulator RcnB
VVESKKPVEGPRGPHLFRASVDSSLTSDEQYTLAMSPMTPKPSEIQQAALDAPQVPKIPYQHRHLSSLTNAVENLNLYEVASWSPAQVSRWMRDAGFEPAIVEKFEENDISGAILITLKFEDLRELDIQSFGQRTKVWNEIHVLRGSAPSTPKPPTPIEEIASPCIESRATDFSRPSLPSRQGSRMGRDNLKLDCTTDDRPSRNESRRRPKRDVITPLESVSIVGIEQLIPKSHKCSKGENCSKWRKQQRLIDNFKNEHPVSPEGGAIWVAGDPGNALTADAVTGATRPISDTVPSVVASSDVLGPGPTPQFRQLEESSLRNVISRDPQEHVKQFIQFQHMDPRQMTFSSEEPPTPPLEMFPNLKGPLTGLRGLPRLAIPPPRPAGGLNPPPRSASANAFSPYRMDRAEAMSPDLRNITQSPSTLYRFGTPFSEMDIPVTSVNLGPVAREASQSVPPNMNYRNAAPCPPARTLSRSSRRPSLVPSMPRVDENASTTPHPSTFKHAHTWSSTPVTAIKNTDDAGHAGWMKKRKTKMLRHEWHEHHFTLDGTRLAMHKDASASETLEYIDVDDYAIACSSLAGGSKLNAAFKAMNISRGNSKKDETAFSFQLIPAAIEKGVRLRKRESMLGGALASSKTHYFAVKSRDERIDWMRELMLAKALKQKSEGFEVTVNGNMI